MDKAILKQIQPLLPQLLKLSEKKESLWFDYDKEADVLYISFQKPQQATDTEMINDDVLIRKRNGSMVGITILHASSFR